MFLKCVKWGRCPCLRMRYEKMFTHLMIMCVDVKRVSIGLHLFYAIANYDFEGGKHIIFFFCLCLCSWSSFWLFLWVYPQPFSRALNLWTGQTCEKLLSAKANFFYKHFFTWIVQLSQKLFYIKKCTLLGFLNYFINLPRISWNSSN